MAALPIIRNYFFLQKQLCLLALLCTTIKSAAQTHDIVYTHFSRSNYLSTNQVNYILQDKNGFRWFATSNGLQCFDGNRWLWFKQEKNATGSLPNNSLLGLLEDDYKRFWILSVSGVCIMNRNTFQFTNIPVEREEQDEFRDLRSLVQLKDGNIWLTSTHGSLYRYNEQQQKFIAEKEIFPKHTYLIYQIAYDSTNRYWLGTDQGLVVYDTKQKTVYTPQYNPPGITILKTDPAQKKIFTLSINHLDQLWFSASDIHTCYDLNKNNIPFCDSISKVWGILGYTTDRQGTTWGYGTTVARMNLATGRMDLIQKTPNSQSGINFNSASHFIEDDEHNYWIATSNGVYVYNRFYQQFFLHTIKNNTDGEVISSPVIAGFIELADKSILVLSAGNEKNMLYHFDEKLNQLPSVYYLNTILKKDESVNLYCGLTDKNGTIWIGSNFGLLKLWPETGRIEIIKDSTLSGTSIMSITEDKDGNLWMGSFNHEIFKREAASGKIISIQLPQPAGKVLDNMYCLWYDGKQSLWAGTSLSGLLKINTHNNNFEKQYLPQAGNHQALPTRRIHDIIETSFNELMMATPMGIVIMNRSNETFRLLTTGDGLPDNNIHSLIKGEKRTVWVVSNNGISKLNLNDMRITSYGIAEGLTNDLLFKHNEKLQISDGRILIGHNKGFTVFNPAKLANESVPEDVKITGVKLFDRYLNTDSIIHSKGGMELSYRQNFITIEFSNMSFLYRDKLEYYYQLENMDDDWVKAGEKLQATYNYVPGGHYMFRVKCKTKDGIPSEKITALHVHIEPPFWKQKRFFLLCVLLAGGIAYSIWRTKERRRIETETVRSRIARDLHDDMGSTLSTINILSEMAKKKIDKDSGAAKTYIEQIGDNSNRIMESMDDIVWSIDPANDNMEHIVSRMREFAGNLLEAKGISYTFKEDERIKHMNLALGKRHDFFMIFKEAVNNLAKYSSCTEAAITISLKKNKLVMQVTDNGKGFVLQEAGSGNGLTNMQRRATSLAANFSVKSQPNKGTSIELEIPL
jgi:ligand-binding sensor domain-containing protein/two-component sensor histidine kinase